MKATVATHAHELRVLIAHYLFNSDFGGLHDGIYSYVEGSATSSKWLIFITRKIETFECDAFCLRSAVVHPFCIWR